MAITLKRYAIFNGWNFNNVPGLSVYAISPPGFATRTLNIFTIARGSLRKLSSAFYESNTITLGIYITASQGQGQQDSRATLQAAMDTLMANIQAQEGTLQIPSSNGIDRTYTATYSTAKINNAMANTDSPAGDYIDLTLTFEASDSFGYDPYLTPMINTSGITSSPNTWNWTFKGSADTQVPVLSFYFTGGTLGSGTVVVGNQGTGQAVTVTRTWAVGDTLTIDCRNKKVQVNGVDVVFSGAIPEFGLGLQTISYSDNFTSRTYSPYFYVYNRYI